MPMAAPDKSIGIQVSPLPESLSWKVTAGLAKEKPRAREGHCSCIVGDDLYIFGGVSLTPEKDILENGDLWRFSLKENQWTELKFPNSSEKPLSRSAATMASVGTKLYLFGGLNHSVGWLNDLFVFDTETNTWFEEDEFTGNPPSPRDKLCSAVIGEKIWLFGGFGQQAAERGPLDMEDEEDLSSDDEIGKLESQQQAAQFGWFDDLHVYDTKSKSWSQPMQMSMGKPSPRCAASMVAHNDTLVVFGGRDAEGRLNDLHFFDTKTKKWMKDRTIQGTAPACRSFHSAVLYGPNAMVVTGGRSLQDQHFGDFYTFTFDDSLWTKINSVGMDGRGCHTMNTIGNCILIFGGSSSYNPSQQHCETFHGDLLIADLSTSEESEGSPKKMRKDN